MLMPLKSQRAAKRQVSKIANFPPPTGGWHTDVVNGLSESNTARILQNIVPKQNKAFVRSGSQTISNVVGSVETLASFDSGVLQHLIAAAGATVYQIPASNIPTLATPIEIETGFSNAKWQTVMMSNAADESFLLMVNGVDGIWTYDGAVMLEATASAGNETVNNVTSFKTRPWFTKVDSASLWYGEVLSPKPAVLTEFPLGPLLRHGGSIVAIDSLSMDGGSGPDDYLVAVSSRGEIVVFAGIDPADSMALVGIFKAARPLGQRCLVKNGSDLVYYGTNGPQLLSKLFAAVEGLDNTSIPIRTDFENAIYQNEDVFGWEAHSYSRRGWMIFNVPFFGGGSYDQFVLNMESQSWFRITGWNGVSWSTHEGNLYFGTTSGKVVRADYGGNDDGAAIDFDFAQSWQEFESVGRKKFNMAQVTIEADATPSIVVDMNVDYKDEKPTSEPGFPTAPERSPWNTSPWNTSPWSGKDSFFISSFGLSNIGYVGALRYRGQIKDSSHALYGFRIAFEEGDFL